MSALRLLPPIHIHPILWFFIFISIITGTFIELSVIFVIVVIHELGHYTMAKFFHWRIRRINLWVFGGVMETDEHGNKSIKEEVLIVLAGPIQHIWVHLFLLICSEYSLLSPSILTLALQFNATIFLFNLLPIWPLDGGKLLFLLNSLVLPYKKAHTLMIITSILCLVSAIIIVLLFHPFTLSTTLLVGFILWENRLEWKQRYYVFIRFLLRRYTDGVKVKKIRPIIIAADAPLMNVFSQFRRNCSHHIHVQSNGHGKVNAAEEQEFLNAYFNFKQYQATAGEIVDS
ncbi:M50 family metallopeptidase [Aquibacillus saliphilus]|uniref:M50 family metallopeptidase n=1 Tax=Aquibacillus saliphilus TaxID=1909422 RepID=UPI001CF06061|nr:M50 family metallopeptidase [Aquibacillus saliphilus]